MRLTFLGTRAHIEAATRQHRRHSSMLVKGDGGRVMIDCGADWRRRVNSLKPDAIVLTHGHPDHAFGLKGGAPCPVHATEATWATIGDFPVAERHAIEIRQAFEVCGVSFEAFSVAHSTRCPAVGYRIIDGRSVVFYVPDVAYIEERDSALADLNLYIGDGASLERSLIRKTGDSLIGHAPVRQQLTWCHKAGVRRAVFTHCGREIVESDGRRVAGRLRRLAHERGVEARFAYDGLRIDLN